LRVAGRVRRTAERHHGSGPVPRGCSKSRPPGRKEVFVNIRHRSDINKRRYQTPEQLAVECLVEAHKDFKLSALRDFEPLNFELLKKLAIALAGKRARGACARPTSAKRTRTLSFRQPRKAQVMTKKIRTTEDALREQKHRAKAEREKVPAVKTS